MRFLLKCSPNKSESGLKTIFLHSIGGGGRGESDKKFQLQA